MEQQPHQMPHQHRVTAQFGDHEESFELVSGTTLAELVERLAKLSRQNHGWPLGISVVFDTGARAQRGSMSRKLVEGASADQRR